MANKQNILFLYVSPALKYPMLIGNGRNRSTTAVKKNRSLSRNINLLKASKILLT